MNELTEREVSVLGVRLLNCSYDEGIDLLEKAVLDPEPRRAMIVNAYCINIGFNNPNYRRAVNSFNMRFVDGIGVLLAGRILKGIHFTDLGGSNLGKSFMQRCAERKFKVFFLGAKPGVAEQAAENFRWSIPGINIVGCQHGYFSDKENDRIIERINKANPDVLIVCFGKPKEVLWIEENFQKLNIKLAIPLGAFFDFHSGRVKRAPVWIQKIHFEWLYRLILEPRRLWKRYIIGNFLFMGRVLKWKLFPKSACIEP